ncbi:type 2 lanthipeptide synthetase LanM [Enterococcus sp. BWR-S5]|uniref:type 2 lanthipeptide synthetase LanM n=1 Tax=Enterococcus sp. BWR-S5 TaxID=2787714 RepID=UPI001923BE77|nr:type 2 lanthipeptide synthetase LanM [Enterococcus sp. BWR-S5]MBL1223590.1 type 2 lantipeptide synthetase LanM [Enterococcus sp. BWR-S5]
METITYSYAASLKERINCWEEHYSATEDYQNFRTLKERKSLLTAEDYQKMLRSNGLDEAQIDIGLSSFSEEKAKLLICEIEEEEWFSLHQQLFASEQDHTIRTIELQTALRFHADYYREQIGQYLKKYSNQLEVTSSALADCVEQFQDELFFIARKTLAWDVHQVVEQWSSEGLTKEAEFEKYIMDYLGTKDSVYNFFSAYPVLAKLLACRLQFACDNFAAFIDSILASADQLSMQFSIHGPFRIDRLIVGKGDSHQKGKTVIEFRVNGRELMFKYKNLEIAHRFNQLLSFLETTIPTVDFYQINRIVETTYTIEEKVRYTPCISDEEVELFYSRYGQLLAVAYWLGATDLHMENVIACGSYPVLIDVETLIRPKLFAENSCQTGQQALERDSVLTSGLVPHKRSFRQTVAIDALSGQRQKLPYKVRQLRQSSSSDICFELTDGYMEGAQNVPILNGAEVDYMAYREAIVAGFQSMNEALLKHKAAFLEQVSTLFADVPVRVILRDTQSYGEYLMFAAHPECMSNYVERERVIGNLWRTEHVPEDLVLEEIEAMTVNDVPLFQINSSERTIIANGRPIIVAEKSPLEAVRCRISAIDSKTVQQSMLLLKEGLELLHYELQSFPIKCTHESYPSAGIKRAVEIGDMVVEQLFRESGTQRIFTLKVTLGAKQEPIISYSDENLYDGLGGIYLFLLTLNHFVPKQAYQSSLEQLEKQLFDGKSTDASQGIVTGLGMRILLDFFAAELLQEKRYEERLLESLCELSEQNLSGKSDWLGGTASLYTLLSEIYKVYPYPIIKDLLVSHGKSFVLEKMEDASFAHGYAGVLYALEKMDEVLQDNELEKKIGQCRFMLLSSYANEEMHNLSWCRGAIGLKSVLTIGNEEAETKRLRANILDDCICHGQAGILSDEELLNSSLVTNPFIRLTSDEDHLPLDLFTGLSGIGYQLLRSIFNSKVRSILFLKQK